MLGEERLGRPLDQAIDAMCERIGSPDLEYVATAVNVQSQTGGSLAGLFDTLSETVRERQRHARKVHALTSLGRMSAIDPRLACPIGLAALMTLISPVVHGAAVHDVGRPRPDRPLPRLDGDRRPVPQANRHGEVLAMIILLVAGIACLALCGFQLTRPRVDRRARAPRGARDGSLGRGRRRGRPPDRRAARPVLLARVSALLVRRPREALAQGVAGRRSPRSSAAPGASRRLTAELFMAGRVGAHGRWASLAGLHARRRRAADRARDRLRGGRRLPARLLPAARRRPGAPTGSTPNCRTSSTSSRSRSRPA